MRIAAIGALLFGSTYGRTIDIARDLGVVAGDDGLGVCNQNTAKLNVGLAQLAPGDTLLVPNETFWFNGGVEGYNISDVTFMIDGTLKWQNNQTAWPRFTPTPDGKVKECMYFENLDNVTFTSSGTGTLDGNGEPWWGYISYLIIGENRPRLLHIEDAGNLLVENLLLRQSPYWTFYAHDINGIEIRDSAIEVHRDNASYHDLDDIGAFNTDGFDIAGANVYVHDVTVWNDDDCVCVKELDATAKRAKCSENWLVERVNASGVGLTIGSIGPSAHHTCVKNITFRDSEMVNTFKGIYMKSRPTDDPTDTGEITDVLYQNITINNASQWSIWIGPQQAFYGGACNLLWPDDPDLPCPVPSEMTWSNITLRDITVNGGSTSPGVVLGNQTNVMEGVLFDNVVVNNPSLNPLGDKYYICEATQGIATGGTRPVPPCFKEVDNHPVGGD